MSTAGPDALLELHELHVQLPISGELRPVLHDVSFSIRAGEALGLVGESGSGKSMTARAIARLLPPGAVSSGTITYAGGDVSALKGPALRTYRAEVAVVFQDPRVHVNPVRSIGDFMTEALCTNHGVSKTDAAAGRCRCWPRSASWTGPVAWNSIRTSSPAGCSSG